MKVNLGSWANPLPNYINVDIVKWPGVDMVADLNKLPWPFPDGCVRHVRAIDILEHLGGVTKLQAVSELARIIQPEGSAEVRVPCGTNAIALQSLQHAHVFYLDTFQRDYAQPWFECKGREVSFIGGRITVPFIRPYRPIIRLLCRMGFGYCITFHLRKP